MSFCGSRRWKQQDPTGAGQHDIDPQKRGGAFNDDEKCHNNHLASEAISTPEEKGAFNTDSTQGLGKRGAGKICESNEAGKREVEQIKEGRVEAKKGRDLFICT